MANRFFFRIDWFPLLYGHDAPLVWPFSLLKLISIDIPVYICVSINTVSAVTNRMVAYHVSFWWHEKDKTCFTVFIQLDNQETFIKSVYMAFWIKILIFLLYVLYVYDLYRSHHAKSIAGVLELLCNLICAAFIAAAVQQRPKNKDNCNLEVIWCQPAAIY